MAKKKKIVITPKEEFAYGHIIEALAGGLYPNKFHVIREYIQNGFDAIVNWKAASKKRHADIKVTIQKPSIFIFDDGTGMDRHTMNEYRKVGFSKKKVGEFAGFRGIGKLAGISVAKKLIVTSSPYGIGEKYSLTFDAEAMLKEIRELKKNRENIPLNDLIEKYTALTSSKEQKNGHYTMIELQEVRQDSKILFNSDRLIEYLSQNVPVPFDPKFIYGAEIEEDIRKFVDDYNSVDITVDGINVYKPYSQELKTHKHILVWNSKEKGKSSAFCWYCENKKKGQILPTKMGGLIYRYKNFAVGDNYLTRKTIWDTSPHLAFYFMGEIYITDPDIIPTSQRDDFEQSTERDRFYKDANKVIAPELNSIARKSSGIRRAEEYVIKGAEVVSQIEKDIKKRAFYLRDLSVEKITQLFNVAENIEKREKNIPEEDKKARLLAKRVVKRAKKLLKGIDEGKETEKEEFNIVKKLKLNKQSEQVYATVIRTLKDFFINKSDDLEKIIKIFHRNLRAAFSKRIN